MKVQLLETSYKKYGGNIYEKILADILDKNFEVEIDNIGVKSNGKARCFNAIKYFSNMYNKSRDSSFDIAIKPYQASLFLNKGKVKNVILIHHIDSSYSPIQTKLYQEFLEFWLKINKKKIDAIIVVSKYWKNYLKKQGFENIYTLYNQFNLEEFNISDNEVKSFKQKYNLSAKPIVYLGNPQKKKGVDKALEAIKTLDAQFISSGTGNLKLEGVKNIELNYREYLTLLKISDVVLTMSQFKEGWCRVAHEAMLCKTPVIGSGFGGMKELLEGGKQIIVEDFTELKDKVLSAIENKKKLGEVGYRYASQFGFEKFEKDLLDILKKIMESENGKK